MNDWGNVQALVVIILAIAAIGAVAGVVYAALSDVLKERRRKKKLFEEVDRL